MVSKEDFRRGLLSTRKGMAREDLFHRSLRIQQKVVCLEPFQRSRMTALYFPIANEVETWELFRRVKQRDAVALFPKVVGDRLVFLPAESRSGFVEGHYGMPEPVGQDAVPIDRIECLILPGVAFDLWGHRLGFGKGYYDRALKDYRGFRIGLGYDFQVVPDLPFGDADHGCHCVVTESRVIWGSL